MAVPLSPEKFSMKLLPLIFTIWEFMLKAFDSEIIYIFWGTVSAKYSWGSVASYPELLLKSSLFEFSRYSQMRLRAPPLCIFSPILFWNKLSDIAIEPHREVGAKLSGIVALKNTAFPDK